jgi:hypothetical protein
LAKANLILFFCSTGLTPVTIYATPSVELPPALAGGEQRIASGFSQNFNHSFNF